MKTDPDTCTDYEVLSMADELQARFRELDGVEVVLGLNVLATRTLMGLWVLMKALNGAWSSKSHCHYDMSYHSILFGCTKALGALNVERAARRVSITNHPAFKAMDPGRDNAGGRRSGGPAFRWSGIPVVRHSGGPAFRWSGIPVVRHSGMTEFQGPWTAMGLN